MNLEDRDGIDEGMAPETCFNPPGDDGVETTSAGGESGYPPTLLLEIQRDLAISLLSCACLADCLELLLESALRLPGFDCGGAYLYDKEAESLSLVCHRGLSDGFVDRVSHYAKDTQQVALVLEGNQVYSMRADLPLPLGPAIESDGLEVLAVLPLRNCGRLVAVLSVSSRRFRRIESDSRVAVESLVTQSELAIASLQERDARLIAESQLKERTAELEAAKLALRDAELHQSEARFRQLAEATFEGLAVSENGILIDGNPQLAALHGYSLEEMIGRPVADFVAPESRALVARRIRDGVETSYQCYGLRKDGSVFPTEVRGCMRTWQGRETRVTALRDLTEVRCTAARLQSLQTELQHAQRLGLVSEVSAGIIHQIGQPLCSMGINLSAALMQVSKCSNPKCGVQPMIEDVGNDVARLRDTVVHLRTLANPSQSIRGEVDLNEMISDVVGILSQEASRRRIDIEVDLSTNLPRISADSVQLSQVLLNLLHNAFDASEDCPDDRRSVAITTCETEDGGVEFDVRDSGSGIAPGAEDELFAPFFTTKLEGIGMGLRLSRTIVQAHGGTIEGFNNPGGMGSTFRVRIPVEPMMDDDKV